MRTPPNPSEAFILDLRAKVRRWGLVPKGDLQGISPEEVQLVEQDQRVPLPELYRVFLLNLGRESGLADDDEWFHFPGILGLKSKSIEDDDYPEQEAAFLRDVVIIQMWHDRQYNFVRPCEGADPPVYARDWCSDGPMETRLDERLSSYLLSRFNRHRRGRWPFLFWL